MESIIVTVFLRSEEGDFIFELAKILHILYSQHFIRNIFIPWSQFGVVFCISFRLKVHIASVWGLNALWNSKYWFDVESTTRNWLEMAFINCPKLPG